jgi:hypothetical protein
MEGANLTEKYPAGQAPQLTLPAAAAKPAGQIWHTALAVVEHVDLAS